MKRLARLFSALVMAFLLWSAWTLIQPGNDRVARLPEAPVITPPAIDIPGMLERLPDFPDLGGYLPQSEPDDIRLTSPVERILIEKAARRMTIWQRQGPAKTYRIQLGSSPRGDKSRQGDGRTPEGVFRVDRLNPQSRFHLSLGIDYPQRHHREAARRAGVSPGGDIMIHGQPNAIPAGYRVKGDWTEGCVAVTDDEIREIYAQTRIGTLVEIRP